MGTRIRVDTALGGQFVSIHKATEGFELRDQKKQVVATANHPRSLSIYAFSRGAVGVDHAYDLVPVEGTGTPY